MKCQEKLQSSYIKYNKKEQKVGYVQLKNW